MSTTPLYATQTIKVTCDVGGTFTDVVASDDSGRIQIGKALTTPHNLIDGLLAALAQASEGLGLDVADLLARTTLFVYSTTQGTNAILQGTTARTALLCTEGFPDVLVRREGGSLHPYDFSHAYPEPYIPRHLTFEIRERIAADGTVLIALDDAQARRVLAGLADAGVEAVAVALLWSVANGVHEQRLGELCTEMLPGVPVTLSHVLNPIVREYRRTSCAAIDASLKPLMQSHLAAVEHGLRDAGLAGQLVAATSMGGVLPIDHLTQRPIYAAKSGPSLAPVAAQLYADLEFASGDAVVCDTGGTSFDVSLVRGGRPVFTRETWLGEEFSGHHTGLASVDVRSIGAGGGSIAWIDPGGLLRVGPQSAGSTPGPACYGRGGTEPTVTDAACALGYLDPNGLLDGRMALDERAAITALARLGADLGVDARDAAAAVLTLAGEHMVGAIREITINQGVDPRDVVMVAGGGAAGLNITSIAEALEVSTVFLPRTAGALSAFGGQYSDIVFEVGASVQTVSSEFDFVTLATAFGEIDARLDDFAATLPDQVPDVRRERFVEARYAHQVWTLDLPLGERALTDAVQVTEMVQSFHALHERIFAVRDATADVEILQCRGRLVAQPFTPTMASVTDVAISRPPRTRRAYFPGHGELEVPVLQGDELPPGSAFTGPLLVTEPSTTIVVPPGISMRTTQFGNYVLEM